MAALLTLASFIAIVSFLCQKSLQSCSNCISCLQAVFASGSNALETSKLLMRDAKNATELFEIATKDMENWHSTYLQAIKEFHQKMLPEYICPDVSVPLSDLTILEKQIEKVSFKIANRIRLSSRLDFASYRLENVAKKSLSN